MLGETNFAALWEAQAQNFAPSGQFSMAYIAPPAELAQFVTTFYIFRSSESLLTDVQPAGVGHWMFFLKGHGQARFHDGHIDQSHDASLICPSNAAMQYIVEGPFHCFGCAFTPLGWRSLTGVPANKMMDQLLNANAVVRSDCEDLLAKLRAIDDGYPSNVPSDEHIELGKSLMHEASPLLSQCFRDLPRGALERVACIADWLETSYSPCLDDLVAKLGLSERQTQRLVTEYFGCAPKFLARKYRAIRVAMALADPRIGDEEQSKLYDLFYDQSHMIREIRHFVGKTPAGLAHTDNGLLQMWLDSENVRELRRSSSRH